jgi:hypothetical protein
MSNDATEQLTLVLAGAVAGWLLSTVPSALKDYQVREALSNNPAQSDVGFDLLGVNSFSVVGARSGQISPYSRSISFRSGAKLPYVGTRLPHSRLA